MDSVIDVLPKLGLLISIFFCLSPLPALFKSVFSDKSAMNSLSIPGTLMGFSCSTSIIAMCSMKGLDDCVYNCSMFIAQGFLTLAIFAALNRAYLTFLLILVSQMALAYGVFNLFSDRVTDLISLGLNILACTTMALD